MADDRLAFMMNFRITHKDSKKKAMLEKRDLVLFVLLALRKAGRTQIPEAFLHKAVNAVCNQSAEEPCFQFVSKPIVYSGGLYSCLKRLERERLLNEMVFVHNGWVPKHFYELTQVGLVEAEDRFDAAVMKGKLGNGLSEALLSSELLSFENQEEKSRQPT